MPQARCSCARSIARRATALVVAVLASLTLVVGTAGAAQASQSGRFSIDSPFSHGAWNVDRTRTYTLFATAKRRPQYIDAAPYPHHPSGSDYFFHREGGSGRHRQWTLRVTMTGSLRSHTYWNVGVRTGDQVHRVKIRVLGPNDPRGMLQPTGGSTHQG